jgi:hypothetical protein
MMIQQIIDETYFGELTLQCKERYDAWKNQPHGTPEMGMK